MTYNVYANGTVACAADNAYNSGVEVKALKTAKTAATAKKAKPAKTAKTA